jgi:hypothetical protein
MLGVATVDDMLVRLSQSFLSDVDDICIVDICDTVALLARPKYIRCVDNIEVQLMVEQLLHYDVLGGYTSGAGAVVAGDDN